MDLVEAKGLVETRHPWELARAAFFTRAIRKAIGRRDRVDVLDVGCGDGWYARLLATLPGSSRLVGWDILLDDEKLAIFSEGLPEGMELTNSEPDGTFDAILLMDVIEHVPDDVALMSDLTRRFLKPGGHMVVSVPAWPSLFSKHDVALKHFRRYTPAMGKTAIEASGLTILRSGGLFHGLAAVRRLQVARWGRAEPAADPLATTPEDDGGGVGLGAWKGSPAVTGAVAGVLHAEGVVSWAASAAGIGLPGLSWWALAKKD